MAKIGRSLVTRLVLLLCSALVVSSFSFSVPVADAGQAEGLLGPVRQVTESVEEVANGVVPTVQGVTEAVPSPVTEVTETVTPPVVEATQAVVPPVREVAETATHATQEVVAKVPAPVVTTPKLPSVPAVDPSGETKAVTPTVTHDVEGALGAVTGAANGSRSPASGGSVGTSNSGGGGTREALAPTEAARANSAARASGDIDGMRDQKFGAPAPDGAIRAPLPKWMAYVWPAIALTWRDLAGVLTRWEHDGARLLTASDGGAGGSQGVAGVHASHSAGAASDSSSSPLAPIPAAIGGFTSHVPGEALAYLAIVGILVAAVFIAVKLELAHRGRGSS
ncbi:MAG TPA: hypothetical protein VJ204_13140 [Solirubrobacterales bacterium]|nr:hypothetical protein [Solirubrobacterales bacterium]